MQSFGFDLFVAAGCAAGAPIALAALGGLFTELSGALSVALEGSMLAGAFAAVAATRITGSAALGFAAGLGAGLAIALLVALCAERLGADVFVAGLAANILAPGLVSVVSEAVFKTKGVVVVDAFMRGPQGVMALAKLPVVGPALFGQNAAFYLLALAAALLAFVVGATPLGNRLRAAGERNEAALAAGLDRSRLRIIAHCLAGAAAGLAGASLAAGVGAFVPGMSSGRGWIALVAIYLGGRRPAGVLLASFGFGFLIALASAAQALKGAPAELLLALPYAATAIALIIGRAARGRLT